MMRAEDLFPIEILRIAFPSEYLPATSVTTNMLNSHPPVHRVEQSGTCQIITLRPKA